MAKQSLRFSLLFLAGSIVDAGCGSEKSGGPGGTGGDVGTGGAATGGRPPGGTGGAATGGMATGGAIATGGSGTGGAGTGGGSGGASTGGSGTGGAIDAAPGTTDARDGAVADASAGDRPVTSGDAGGSAHPMMSFFVTSTGSGAMGGNLGGLEMADAKCKTLAAAVGAGDKKWVAWLSIQNGPGGMPVHARDRVGNGPWHDVRGRLIAENLAGLLPGPNMKPMGDAMAVADLLDEKGNPVPKQPIQHDILTGTLANGMLAMGLTCGDWMSTMGMAQLGHSDVMGPADRRSWTQAHSSQGCTMQGVAAGGGNGRIYCLVDTR